jgi:poly(3-hydroxybutyrate) depolymerase
MKSTLPTIALLGLVSSIHGLTIRDAQCGCGAPLPDGVSPNKSVNRTLGDRKYRLHLPAGYDGTQKLPLILSFHGRTQDAKYQEKLSQFSNATYGFQGIAVYPEGVPFTTDVGASAINNFLLKLTSRLEW